MADEWIKVRRNLGNHPKIVRMMSALLADKFRTVGGLHAVWSVFDEFSEDGVLNGYSASTMDLTIGWPGFCEAMISVNWLIDTGSSLAVPEFEEHNGASGKRRAMEAKRKRDVRKESEKRPHAKRTKSGLEEEEEEEIRSKESTFGAGDIRATQHEQIDLLGQKVNGHEAKPERFIVPVAEVVSIYHELLPRHPRVEKINSKRRGAVQARWRGGDLDTLDAWRNYFADVSQSKFLTGRTPPTPPRTMPFIASFDWLVNETNFTKVLEGNYQ